MALRALDPAPKIPLAEGWELLAAEAGRTARGLRATIHLCNGEMQACQTLVLGDAAEQQALIKTFAAMASMPPDTMAKALPKLVVAVEGMLRQLPGQSEGKGPTQATRLVALALDAGAALFHTPEGEAYATITVEEHCETWPLKAKGFRRRLAKLFYDAEGKAPGAQAVQDALAALEGKALFDGPEYPVFTRLAEHQSAVYLDLANESWQAVEMTAAGWCVMDTPPVKFRRARGMLSLPTPVAGGSLHDLRPFVNVADEADWCLLVSWLVAALRPTGPYTVLVLHGEQGSAKSTLVRVLRALVDPNTADTRTIPRDERDLVIAATNGWVIALDNLSSLPDWLSDALCRVATKSGFATRELYTDAEEVIFQTQRPIVINGIEELATRSDLLDRAILLYLPTIPEHARKDEKAFWHTFEQVRPRILGALLDVVSAALRTLPGVQRDRWPRMADFAQWACAAATACGWSAADFLHVYDDHRKEVHHVALETSPVSTAVRRLLDQDQGMWEGTAGELLAQLEKPDVVSPRGWPDTPQALSNVLRRLAPNLRAIGIEVESRREPGGNRRRLITLRTTMQADATPEGGGGDGRDGRDAKTHASSVDTNLQKGEDKPQGEKNAGFLE